MFETTFYDIVIGYNYVVQTQRKLRNKTWIISFQYEKKLINRICLSFPVYIMFLSDRQSSPRAVLELIFFFMFNPISHRLGIPCRMADKTAPVFRPHSIIANPQIRRNRASPVYALDTLDLSKTRDLVFRPRLADGSIASEMRPGTRVYKGPKQAIALWILIQWRANSKTLFHPGSSLALSLLHVLYSHIGSIFAQLSPATG